MNSDNGKLLDPFLSSKRNFIIIGHRAVSDGKINLKDLCGASGRWDGIARCITASLFLSHDMRRDTSIHIVLLGKGDPPKILSVNGAEVKYLNPDERACSALMRKSLEREVGNESGITLKTSPGIHVTRGGLDHLMNRIDGRAFLMSEEGSDSDYLSEDFSGRLYFFLSDDMDLTQDEKNLLEDKCDGKINVGPLSLHSYQAITILHNIMDKGPKVDS
jgi:tRNA (pseudouridine54-N1)-methyltransferase